MIARATDKRSTIAYDGDVLVVGGGAAGVAAAVSAAHAGMKVLLLEKYGFCSGAAVAGLSGTICGLYAATDDNTKPPEQLMFGLRPAVHRADAPEGRRHRSGPLRSGYLIAESEA